MAQRYVLVWATDVQTTVPPPPPSSFRFMPAKVLIYNMCGDEIVYTIALPLPDDPIW